MKRPIVIILLVIALVLICLGIGAVLFFAANGSFLTNNPFDVRNISSVLEESKTLKVDAEKPLVLKVADDAGDVTITGADVDTVQVKVVKTAYDSSQSRADEEVKGIQYAIEQTGNSITLKYELPRSMNFNNKINTVDFVVIVPSETKVNVDTNGEVSVASTIGNVDVKNDFGDISVQNLQGGLTVETESGAVTATSITAGASAIDLHSGFGTITLEKASAGPVRLDSQSGELDMSDVRASGDVNMSTQFGNVNFEKGSARSLTIKTQSGQVKLISLNVSGDLKAEGGFGEIDLQKVKAGSYNLSTDSGSVTLEGAQGAIKVATGFGNISITQAENASLDLNTQSGSIEFEGSLGEGPHTVHSDFGEIRLSLPTDSAVNVDLQTEFGNINSEIPVTVVLNGEAEKSHQVGTMNGGGPELNVSTKSGSITIKALKK